MTAVTVCDFGFSLEWKSTKVLPDNTVLYRAIKAEFHSGVLTGFLRKAKQIGQVITWALTGKINEGVTLSI